MLPHIWVDDCDGISVVRDDIVPGGTKRRALPILLHGAKEFVYAGPVQGFAQIALAYACRDLGKRATIFVAKRNVMHPRTAEAQAAGAQVVEIPCGYLSNVRCRADDYCARTHARLLPFGLDHPDFIGELARIARSAGTRLQHPPREVWCAAGSGVLTRALQLAWPRAQHYAVQIGKVPNAGNAKILVAPEKFEKDAATIPPFPSCSNYDAKVWQFLKNRAHRGVLFWNVAK